MAKYRFKRKYYGLASGVEQAAGGTMETAGKFIEGPGSTIGKIAGIGAMGTGAGIGSTIGAAVGGPIGWAAGGALGALATPGLIGDTVKTVGKTIKETGQDMKYAAAAKQ